MARFRNETMRSHRLKACTPRDCIQLLSLALQNFRNDNEMLMAIISEIVSAHRFATFSLEDLHLLTECTSFYAISYQRQTIDFSTFGTSKKEQLFNRPFLDEVELRCRIRDFAEAWITNTTLIKQSNTQQSQKNLVVLNK